jgi:hypothetical protein
VFEYDVDREKMFPEMWKKGGIKIYWILLLFYTWAVP